MDKYCFSKQHTLITKGMLIIMLLMHHVFQPPTDVVINTFINDFEFFQKVVSWGKICIAGFTFLTAYGMTCAFKNIKNDDIKSYFSITVKRLLKLEMAIAIVYILAVFYKRFIMVQSIRDLYLSGDERNNIAVLLLYMLIDMLGLAYYAGTPMINVTWWYLSYAILLIVAMPFVYKAYNKFRYLLLPAGCLLPYIIMNYSPLAFSQLLPSVILGVAFSYEEWFEKLKKLYGKGRKIIIALVIVYLSFLISAYVNLEFSYTLAFIIPYIAYEFISNIPVLRFVLAYIGKNATNIFLVHTFIFWYFYTDFIYSFQDSWLIFIVLLGLSLGVSIIVELIKKLGYNQLMNKLLKIFSSKLEC